MPRFKGNKVNNNLKEHKKCFLVTTLSLQLHIPALFKTTKTRNIQRGIFLYCHYGSHILLISWVLFQWLALFFVSNKPYRFFNTSNRPNITYYTLPLKNVLQKDRIKSRSKVKLLLKNTQVRQCKIVPHFTGNFEKHAAGMLMLK